MGAYSSSVSLTDEGFFFLLPLCPVAFGDLAGGGGLVFADGCPSSLDSVFIAIDTGVATPPSTLGRRPVTSLPLGGSLSFSGSLVRKRSMLWEAAEGDE